MKSVDHPATKILLQKLWKKAAEMKLRDVDIGRMLGVSRVAVGKWGKLICAPDLGSAFDIARVFEIDMGEIQRETNKAI